MKKPRSKILLVEGAESVSREYERLLGQSYDLIVCENNDQVQKLINARETFDMVLMAMILPLDTIPTPRLADFQNAGLYVLEQLLEHGLCSRFYVITVRKQIGVLVRDLCRKHHAICRFRYKLMYEPDQLINEIRWLQKASVDEYEAECTSTGVALAVRETRDYLKLCRNLSALSGPPDATQLACFGAAMTWLFEALDNPSLNAFRSGRALTDPRARKVWMEWQRVLRDMRRLLEERLLPDAQGEFCDEIEGAIIAIASFLSE